MDKEHHPAFKAVFHFCTELVVVTSWAWRSSLLFTLSVAECVRSSMGQWVPQGWAARAEGDPVLVVPSPMGHSPMRMVTDQSINSCQHGKSWTRARAQPGAPARNKRRWEQRWSWRPALLRCCWGGDWCPWGAEKGSWAVYVSVVVS